MCLCEFSGSSKKVLGDLKFLKGLKTSDKDNIPPAARKRIREKFNNHMNFQPAVLKNVSTICEGLLKGVRRMELQDHVAKVVAPKREPLRDNEGVLALLIQEFSTMRAEMNNVIDNLQDLNNEIEEVNNRKKELEKSIGVFSQKLGRAEKLISGLGGKKGRGTEEARLPSIRHTDLNN
nr:dynein heavy chain 3, axonemal-like [Zootoca vivipara]